MSLVELSLYACNVHTGQGALSYRFVALKSMEILTRDVGKRGSDKPRVYDDGTVTYSDLDEVGEYEMWVGQTWENRISSSTITSARASIANRRKYLDMYRHDAVVKVMSRTSMATVEVERQYVTAYLAQRTGYQVALPTSDSIQQSEPEGKRSASAAKLPETSVKHARLPIDQESQEMLNIITKQLEDSDKSIKEDLNTALDVLKKIKVELDRIK